MGCTTFFYWHLLVSQRSPVFLTVPNGNISILNYYYLLRLKSFQFLFSVSHPLDTFFVGHFYLVGFAALLHGTVGLVFNLSGEQKMSISILYF